MTPTTVDINTYYDKPILALSQFVLLKYHKASPISSHEISRVWHRFSQDQSRHTLCRVFHSGSESSCSKAKSAFIFPYVYVPAAPKPLHLLDLCVEEELESGFSRTTSEKLLVTIVNFWLLSAWYILTITVRTVPVLWSNAVCLTSIKTPFDSIYLYWVWPMNKAVLFSKTYFRVYVLRWQRDKPLYLKGAFS